MDNKKEFILITGASSGIGRAIATNLSKEFNLILHGRDSKKLMKTKLVCSRDNEQLIFNYDFCNIDSLENSFSTFVNENKIEITHYVHSAGLMKMVPVKMVNPEMINTTFNTNVISAILLTKALTSRKINNSALKSIVFISSNISNFGAKAFSVYAASKGALDSFMRCVAVELSPKIRVNSILPGAIHTEMTKTIFEDKETIQKMMATYPLGPGNADDIYNIVRFLISDKARWITGQQFTVDGGRTINITG
jgi:NAD(P)-dependent dehydrogenase (short-subunit alcohol dehydrogenase family)